VGSWMRSALNLAGIVKPLLCATGRHVQGEVCLNLSSCTKFFISIYVHHDSETPGDTALARHAHRVPIYSINGGPRPMIYVSRSEAERLEAGGFTKRISRLKAPALVMRFCALHRHPGMPTSSITSTKFAPNP